MYFQLRRELLKRRKSLVLLSIVSECDRDALGLYLRGEKPVINSSVGRERNPRAEGLRRYFALVDSSSSSMAARARSTSDEV